MSTQTRLYTSSDVARLLGIGAPAFGNRKARGRLNIPEPAYGYQARGGGLKLSPLWTADQMREIAADMAARADALIDGAP